MAKLLCDTAIDPTFLPISRVPLSLAAVWMKSAHFCKSINSLKINQGEKSSKPIQAKL